MPRRKLSPSCRSRARTALDLDAFQTLRPRPETGLIRAAICPPRLRGTSGLCASALDGVRSMAWRDRMKFWHGFSLPEPHAADLTQAGPASRLMDSGHSGHENRYHWATARHLSGPGLLRNQLARTSPAACQNRKLGARNRKAITADGPSETTFDVVITPRWHRLHKVRGFSIRRAADKTPAAFGRAAAPVKKPPPPANP